MKLCKKALDKLNKEIIKEKKQAELENKIQGCLWRLICPECGGKLNREYLPPNNTLSHIQVMGGTYEYTCNKCGYKREM